MESKWSDEDAKAAIAKWGGGKGSNEDLALRTYSARLIGRESALVLHGGGNTSVKTRLPDDLGEPVDVLCVKGSGWDLGAIEPAGHPAVRLSTLAALRRLDALSDEDMVNAARTRLLDASAPNPSVEALLHAFLPHKFIDHSHADAILALVDQPKAKAIAAEVFGDTLAIVDYVMPGFALSKLAAEAYEAHPKCEGLLLLQHGLFTFGATARESYERHIAAVTKAEDYARGKRTTVSGPLRPDARWAALAPALRGRLGKRFVLHRRLSVEIRRFVDAPELSSVSQRGPATPDHVIRTKQKPIVLDPQQAGDDWPGYVEREIAAYRERYAAYFTAQVEAKRVQRTQLDPHPRVVLIPGVGLVTAGADRKAAEIAADIYEHTIDIISDAEAVGRYQALTDDHIFDMEYWSLEQAKLGASKPKPLEGHVVYVTGAGSGIGAATARTFAAAGAQLYLVDRDIEAVASVAEEIGAAYEGLDVRSREAIEASIDRAVEAYGGLDGVVSNAGTAPQAPIHACPPELFEESLAINLSAHQWLSAAAARVMRAQGTGGYLLYNASKAAFNPGPNFGPYAIAKAGLVALMKQHALEGGEVGIRANAINADRVRTGLLPIDVVEKRARARGLDADAYFRSNLLQREVTANDVAEAFLFLARARSTTGAVLTVDGGNIAASPR
jgi:rhamnose utilization protein RhaD (predicted bifunctional aldolase and dehydrogenase)/NAD(P)-dependent dehydrogenase (short-subunit alcohol dehydrogenase family)